MALFTFSAAFISAWKEYKYRQLLKELPEDEAERLLAEQPKKSSASEIISNPDFMSWKSMENEISERTKSPKEVIVFSALGAATGVIAGLLGVGGGVVLLPLLALATDMNQQLIFGTVLTCFVPVTIVGTISHARVGNVVWRLMPTLLVGSAVGAYVGSRFSIYLSESQQRGVVISVMSGVGLRALLK